MKEQQPVAVSTYGFIRFDGNRYIGDCETTTDVLGPFYRPGSPVRNNIAAKGETGNLVMLTGVIKHNDCKTPYQEAKIELWHCNDKGVYDNDSDDSVNRGHHTFSDREGRYFFNTILPASL